MTPDEMLSFIRWLGSGMLGLMALIGGYFWSRLNRHHARLYALERDAVNKEDLRAALREYLTPFVHQMNEVVDHLNVLFKHIQDSGMMPSLRVPLKTLSMPGE